MSGGNPPLPNSVPETYGYKVFKGDGATHYHCLDCSFYVPNNESCMKQHCLENRHGATSYQIGKYIDQERNKLPLDVTVTLGYLCWNTVNASVEGLLALVEEAKRLSQLGCKAKILVLDNGSTDGTLDQMLRETIHCGVPIEFSRFPANQGISRGRNILIEMAKNHGSDFHLFMDGDIEIVPLSSYLMVRYLLCHPEVGCIGAYSSSYVRDRERASKFLLEIPESSIHNDINCAWTQYGMFRSSMFQEGLRFDVDGPLGEPGWGLEDDDFCFQMLDAGWKNVYFSGMPYLHRNIRSSWPNLERIKVDPEVIFHKRKDFVLNKWRAKCFNPDILDQVALQQPPVRRVSFSITGG